MTGTSRSSADLDPRRRRVLVRAWRRGTREMDLILGGFADAEIGSLDTDQLDQFEDLMKEQDADLLAWITGERTLPDHLDTPVFARLVARRWTGRD